MQVGKADRINREFSQWLGNIPERRMNQIPVNIAINQYFIRVGTACAMNGAEAD
jgi:hypothetical protein